MATSTRRTSATQLRTVGAVPIAAPPTHVLSVDIARAERIAQRSRDPKRRDALQTLLKASKSVPAMSTEPRPAPPASAPERKTVTQVLVPSLPFAPVLETHAVRNDASRLNREVMWEDIARENAERASEYEKSLQEATAKRLLKLRMDQESQARRQHRRAEHERKKEGKADKMWVQGITSQYQADKAQAGEAKRANASDMASVLLAQARAVADVLAAEAAQKLAHEKEEAKQAERAEQIIAAHDKKKQHLLVSLKDEQMTVAKERVEKRRGVKPESVISADPIVVETEERNARRVAALHEALGSMEVRTAKAVHVGADASRRDAAADAFGSFGVPDPAALPAFDAAMAARSKAMKQVLTSQLSLQVREKSLRAEIAEQSRLAEQARLRQEAAMLDAAQLQRDEAVRQRRIEHLMELEAQQQAAAHLKPFGFDKAGGSVSEAEWRLNKKLLKSHQSADRNRPPTPPVDHLAASAAVPLPSSQLLPALPSIGAAMLRPGIFASSLGASLQAVQPVPASSRTASSMLTGSVGLGAVTNSSRFRVPSQSSGRLTALAHPPSGGAAAQSASLTSVSLPGGGVSFEPDPYFGRQAVKWYD